MANETTKTKQLEEALEGLLKYVKDKDADFWVAASYLTDLDEWANEPETDSSDPNNPPPPPPGHK
jgi:hypothetical protein